MVKRNYQSEYARRAKSDNLRVYGHNMRVSRRNIEQLSDTLRRALTVRSERETVRSEYGTIAPARLWKLGRSRDKKLFDREVKKDSSEFVVFVLIDASGSQRSRQSLVALQGFIISEALSIVGIPHRVMGFCTFWDYTVMQRYRDYDDPREANKRIFGDPGGGGQSPGASGGKQGTYRLKRRAAQRYHCQQAQQPESGSLCGRLRGAGYRFGGA